MLIEYDRTERPHKQIDRLRRYDRWLLDGWRKGSFAAHAIPPAVIFLTSREAPLSRLIETADETFSASSGGEHTHPRDDTYPARGRVLFASREQVLAGDWMMRRTPACRRRFASNRPSVSHASSSTTCRRSSRRLFVSLLRAAESAAQGVRPIAGPPARVFGWVVVWGLRS